MKSIFLASLMLSISAVCAPMAFLPVNTAPVSSAADSAAEQMPASSAEMTLCASGAVIKQTGLTSYKSDILIRLAGPFANLICYFLFVRIFPTFACAGLILALLNLIPAPPLDGGLAMSSFLLSVLPRERAVKISRAVSVCSAFLLWVFSVYMIFYADFGISVVFVCTALLGGMMSGRRNFT